MQISNAKPAFGVASRPVSGIAPNRYHAALASLRPALGGVFGFSAAVNVLMLTGSIYMLQIYDRVLSSGSVTTLLGLFAIVIALYCFLALYDGLRGRLMSRAALRLDANLGSAAFDRWMQSGLPDAAQGPAAANGKQARSAQVLRDLEAVRGFLSGPTPLAMADVIFVPLFLGVLFLIHPWLGWLTVTGSVIGGLIALLSGTVTARALGRSLRLDTDERNFSDRIRRNAETVVAMGMKHAVTRRWLELHHATLANGQSASDRSDTLAAISRSFRLLLQSAMLTLAAYLVLRAEISAGMIIASSVLSGRALAPVDQLIGQWRVIDRTVAAHRRLKVLFEGMPAAADWIDLPAPTGQIAVTGLSKYGTGRAGAEPPRILSRASFSLAPGDGLGVIGNSASGKSTLARLLVGGTLADEGEIRLDGATLDQWDPVRLGRSIGYLPQMLEMLPGTIRDNLARFDPGIDDKTVIAAARMTGIHEMILKLPEGYATRLGDSETPQLLSGGQMQRLGLARAVCGMPALVVLDEPNSNLDLAGDAALTHAIGALRAAGSTVIVMAHRPSALVAVNKLMLLDAGVVRAFGDKDDILAESYRIAPLTPSNDNGATASGDTPAPNVLSIPGRTQTAAPTPAAALAPTPAPKPEPAPKPVPAAARTAVLASVPVATPTLVRTAGAKAEPGRPETRPTETRQIGADTRAAQPKDGQVRPAEPVPLRKFGPVHRRQSA